VPTPGGTVLRWSPRTTSPNRRPWRLRPVRSTWSA
jgi:hypothetical protein